MILDRITITGADDSVKPEALLDLSAKYPFVEWGILLSAKRMGTPRYPSKAWLTTLYYLPRRETLKLSGHLCGRWVRDLITHRDPSFWKEMAPYGSIFGRMQLNFHGEVHNPGYDLSSMLNELGGDRVQWILQMDGANDGLFRALRYCGRHLEHLELNHVNVVPLFDRSGGAGILPDRWPAAYSGIYNGYAGGLGPDNLTEQLQKIALAAGNEHTTPEHTRQYVWIDIESGVRSEDKFDLAKVETVLALCTKWISTRKADSSNPTEAAGDLALYLGAASAHVTSFRIQDAIDAYLVLARAAGVPEANLKVFLDRAYSGPAAAQEVRP